MKTAANYKIYFTVIFIVLLLAALSWRVIVTDFKLSHESLYKAQPFDWVGYNLKLGFNKFIRSITDDGEIGLPQIRLYISESSQQSLLKDIPNSTKKWKNGYIDTNNGDLQNIKVRHQGDDYFNWILHKKTYKIKTKKDEMFGLHRMYNLFVPESKMFLREYSAKNISNRMNVLAPDVELVELFVNDESRGIYIKSEALNESFLRYNKVMPVNLYKGEQNHSEKVLGLYYDLFNNPSLWSKKSYFNKKNKKDKSDLQSLFSLIRGAEIDNNEFIKMLNSIDIEKWSNFGAFEVLTQSFSSDYRHNQRLVLDPWTGKAYPIAHDSYMSDSFFSCDYNSKDSVFFERSITPREHNLWLLLNSSSMYINKKYKKINHFTKNNKVLLKEAKHIKELKTNIEKSYGRDIDHITIHGDSDIVRNVEMFSESLFLFNKCIVDRLSVAPDSTWNLEKNGFVVTINGEVPISNIVIDFNGLEPEWVEIDLNGNSHIDNDEKIPLLRNERGELYIPITLYANRIVVAGGGIHKDNELRRKDIVIANTGFKFIIPNNYKIKSISASNPFSKQDVVIKNNKTDYVFPHRLNRPIISKHLLEGHTVISGVLNVTGDKFYKNNVTVLPGTTINISPGASLIFYNKVTALGTSESPITIKRSNPKHAWGVIALQGSGTRESVFDNINISGGSGSEVNGVYYTAMFSMHDTGNILIENSNFSMNEKYDDMLHIVYGDNIKFNNVSFVKSVFDAIDIDMSKKIILRDIKVFESGNDAIDFMETEALVDRSNLYGSGDKGISSGENSDILVYNSLLRNNKIGLASKDGSNVALLYSDLDSNEIQLSLYKKNWRYNDGGHLQVHGSRILNGKNNFSIDEHSDVLVKNTKIDGIYNNSINDMKNDVVFDNIDHPLLKYVVPIDKNIYGSR